MKSQFSKFAPHPLFVGGVLQTIAGQLGNRGFDAALPLPGYRSFKIRLPLPDGDETILDIDEPEASDILRIASHTNLEKVPTIVTLHGLGGDAHSTYNLRLRQKFATAGLRVARFNHRGCGRTDDNQILPARGIYHAGRSEDIAAALGYVCRKWPNSPVVVLGFSLSGNAMLKSLAQFKHELQGLNNLVAACSVCAPLDLELCSVALTRRRFKIMDAYYMKKMRRVVATREALVPGEEKIELPRETTLRDFDEIYTAPRGGFRDRSHYYQASSSLPVINSIELPTLILGAKNDPIVPPKSYDGIKFSGKLELDLQGSGGHMGFIQKNKTTFGDYRWMDAYLFSWVQKQFGSHR